MNPCFWASDFSYSYFKKILQTAKSSFELHQFKEAPKIVGDLEKPKLILRHDVDVSPMRALAMARVEKEFGIRSTYFVMTESPCYCMEDDTSRDIFQKIMDMGHEIGLHLDPRTHGTESTKAKIDSACKELENIIGLPVSAFSFHRPPDEYLRGRLTISNRVNAYAEELMKWYLSDSKGRWKCGEPLPKLLRPEKPLLQLLIHPIWWGNEHMSGKERVQAFVLEESRGKSPDFTKSLRKKIKETISV